MPTQRKSIRNLLVLLVLSVGALTASHVNAAHAATPEAPPKTLGVVLNGRVFSLELAFDHDARQRGLSGRPTVNPEGGMLFISPVPRVRQYWMKDCLVPLDIVFLSASGHIVSMHEMEVEPEEIRSNPTRRYGSGKPAQFAIELAGGTLKQLDLQDGQKIELPYEMFKRYVR